MIQPGSDRPAFGRFAAGTRQGTVTPGAETLASRPQRFATVAADNRSLPSDNRAGTLPVLGSMPRLATSSSPPSYVQPSAQQQPPRPTLQELADRGNRPPVVPVVRRVEEESDQSSFGDKLTALARRKHQSMRQWTSTAVIILLLAVSVYSFIALQRSPTQLGEPQSLVADSAPEWKPTPIVITADPADDQEEKVAAADEVIPQGPQLSITKPAQSVAKIADQKTKRSPTKSATNGKKIARRSNAPKARATGVTSVARKPTARPTKLPSGSSPYPETSYPVVDLSRIQRRIPRNESAPSPPAVAELPGRIEPYTR